MDELLDNIRQCTTCKSHLPYPPKPILQASVNSKIAIIGQAPGLKVQESGIPWDDKSGDALREWLGVSKDQFYNPDIFALIPMGFCYPGRGRSGGLPPRPECAPLWHEQLLGSASSIRLTLLIGQYAQKYYLKKHTKSTLTDTVKSFREYLPNCLPLVHPSPRNNIWKSKNPWFDKDVVPELQGVVREVLASGG